jgi:ribosomal protein S18 acetylase RimI-like enzyme
LIYRDAYWDEPDSKSQFIRFLVDIHNLDLTLWDELGYWDENYTPFSYFDDDRRVVASVQVYSMDMMIKGKRCRAAQLSGVGTRPDCRRRGLNKELTEKAIAWARPNHDFFFLFADAEALEFYRKCGFRIVDEYKPCIAVEGGTKAPGIERLDMGDPEHRDRVYELACNRAPVSDYLGVFDEKLFMYWCLYWLKDCVFYIADLDALVLFKREDGVVTVYDIVGKQMPGFSDLYPYIRSDSDWRVEFEFMPDKLNLTDVQYSPFADNGTHLLGTFPLEFDTFFFPLTAHA